MPAEFEAVRSLFNFHYIIFAFLTCLGALQIAAAASSRRGLYVLPSRGITYIAGLILIFSASAFLFLSPLWIDGPWVNASADSSSRLWGRAQLTGLGYARNVNDIDGGLAGTDQASLFAGAAALAFLASLAMGQVNSFLFYRRIKNKGTEVPDGLESLDFYLFGKAAVSSFRITQRRFIPYLNSSLRASPEISIWKIVVNAMARRESN